MLGLQLDLITWSFVRDSAYCEYMAYLNTLNGRYKPVAKRGKAKAIVKKALSELGLRYSMEPVADTVDGVTFYLRPDAVIFDDNKTKAVMMLKAYIRRNARVYESDFIPLYIAGYLLEKAGIRVEGSKLVVIASKSESDLLNSIKNLATGIMEAGEVTVKYRVYMEETALRFITRILGLVKGYRKPIPASTPPKCSTCTYKDECTYRVL